MITVKEAIELIRENVSELKPVNFPLNKAGGLILAENVFAMADIPNFSQSSMDGYAFRFDDLTHSKDFTVHSEVAAGDHPPGNVPAQHAVRIFTGAEVPHGLDTVVMQEKVERKENMIRIVDEHISRGNNTRSKGSEIKKGETALTKRSLLTPAAVGFLAGAGINEVNVYPMPSVSIIVTGNELINPGEPLLPGKVYESNSVMLLSALKQLHVDAVKIFHAADNSEAITGTIQHALETSDLILLTGGVSVGDHDLVVECATGLGIKKLFHKVKQRPGKPLYAGRLDNKIIFGLPGNPASVLSCFYNYVVPAIENFTGKKNIIQRKIRHLTSGFIKKIPFTQFLKGECDDEHATILSAQESFRLSSFSLANCLIILPEDKMEFKKGEPVETLILPYL